MQNKTIGKKKLIDFLKQIDKYLSRKIRINCAGGTGLTLLNAKNSTKDIDFDLNQEDKKEFESSLKKLPPHGLKIDVFSNGLIFSQKLPQDYEQKCVLIKTNFKNTELYSLSPLDIAVSKIGRLNERDIDDIKTCIKKFKLSKKQFEKRAKLVDYVGYEETFKSNLKFALKKLFP